MLAAWAGWEEVGPGRNTAGPSRRSGPGGRAVKHMLGLSSCSHQVIMDIIIIPLRCNILDCDKV